MIIVADIRLVVTFTTLFLLYILCSCTQAVSLVGTNVSLTKLMNNSARLPANKSAGQFSLLICSPNPIECIITNSVMIMR